MEKQIGVVICNYNGGEYLRRCVESIMASDRDDYDIIIVDNASTDGSSTLVKDKYSQVILINNNENLGGAGGFDIGFRYALKAGYPYIMAMDNDAIVAEDAIRLLYEYLSSHNEAGMAAAKIMCMEESDRILDYNGRLDFRNMIVWLNWWMKPDCEESQRVSEADFAPTTASMIKREALEASGGMDPEYFIYLDDIDMSQRIIRSGYKVVSVGKAKAWHKSGFSQHGIQTTFKQYYFSRNRYYFFSKYISEKDIPFVVESILRDAYKNVRCGESESSTAKAETARYALEDFISGIRGKAPEGRVKEYAQEMRDNFDSDFYNESEFATFKKKYEPGIKERIAVIRAESEIPNSNLSPKVSVVIPVYNSVVFLRECLDSVLGQTLKDIEVICVDDGSTDGSGQILDEYEKKDSRVIVIHKENEGYGKAVNTGIQEVSAPYFGIVESDDTIDSDMYRALYDVMQRTSVDVVKSDYYKFYKRDGKIIREYVHLSDTGGGNLYCRRIDPVENPEALLYGKYTWTGLYNTEYIKCNQIRHNETPGASYQDNGFWFQTIVRAGSIFFLDEAYYNYRQDNIGASFFDKGKPFAELDEFRYAEGKLEEMGKDGYSFHPWLSLFLLSNGYYAFNRVKSQYKTNVAHRVREEFYRLSDKGWINCELFPDWIVKEIFYMIGNPERAAMRNGEIYDRFAGILLHYQKYIIYGAGKWANKVMINMKSERFHQRLVCFAVSDTEGNPDTIEGIPVIQYAECTFDKDTLVIIAVKASEGIEENLRVAGAENIMDYSELYLW